MNTTQENQLAISAYKKVLIKYAPFISMNQSVSTFSQAMVIGKNVDLYVKFMDDAAFMKNYSLSGSQKMGSGCALCGFTAAKLGIKDDREIYINRKFANPSTLIHEMLHFLTHPDFWKSVGPQVTEAITEYFTRKVLGRASDEKFDLSQREGRYDSHHFFLTQGRVDIKTRANKGLIKPGKDYMKRAYFQGDTTALSFIKGEFKEIEELLKAAEKDG